MSEFPTEVGIDDETGLTLHVGDMAFNADDHPVVVTGFAPLPSGAYAAEVEYLTYPTAVDCMFAHDLVPETHGEFAARITRPGESFPFPPYRQPGPADGAKLPSWASSFEWSR